MLLDFGGRLSENGNYLAGPDPALSRIGVLDFHPGILLFEDTNFRAVAQSIEGARFIERAIADGHFRRDHDSRPDNAAVVKSRACCGAKHDGRRGSADDLT